MTKAKKSDAEAADPGGSVIVNSRPILKDPSVLAQEEVKEPLLTAPVLPIETIDDKKTAPDEEAPPAKTPAKEKPAAKPDKKLAAEDSDTHVIQVKRLSIKPLSEAQPTAPESTETAEPAAPEPAPAAEAPAPKTDEKPQVQPLVDKPAEEAAPAQEAPEPTPEPAPKTKPEPAAEPAATPVKEVPELPEAEPEAKPAQEVSEPTDQPPKVDLDAEAKAKAEHDAAIQKLVDSKKYFLPINAVEKRRSKRFVAVGFLLSLFLLVAWADIAADAGLISVPGVKPVTHFFSN